MLLQSFTHCRLRLRSLGHCQPAFWLGSLLFICKFSLNSCPACRPNVIGNVPTQNFFNVSLSPSLVQSCPNTCPKAQACTPAHSPSLYIRPKPKPAHQHKVKACTYSPKPKPAQQPKAQTCTAAQSASLQTSPESKLADQPKTKANALKWPPSSTAPKSLYTAAAVA